MSVLETPRIMFRGRITWDPIVTNNSAKFYNESASSTVFRSGETVADFRASAIKAVPGGVWNVDGTHRSVFYETQVVSVDLGAGPTTKDPFVSSPVAFAGMLIDLEPYGIYTSQLFFDSMSFGINGGCQVFAPRHTRMNDRYINFNRNTGPVFIAGGASVVWQTSFPKAGGLRVDPHDSRALAALAHALQDEDVLGLTVRWNSYRTIYFDDAALDSSDPQAAVVLAELQKKLTGGGFQPSPARSELVGVLGLWRKGEPRAVPGDRAMVTQNEGVLGSGWTRLSPHHATIDLSNSIPETGQDLHKTDLGDLTLVAVSADGKTVEATLGTFPPSAYNREAYDETAGIVTLPIDEAAAHKAAHLDLQLRQADGTVLLREAALRACPEDPNIYLDEGASAPMHVLALDRGVPKAALVVTLADAGASSPIHGTAATNGRGLATFEIHGKQGRVDEYVILVNRPSEPPPTVPTQIDPQLNDYVYVRTLPADGRIAALAPTWENVHKYVLANWEAMAPCMDNWLRLGDPVQVKAFAPILRRLTDKGNFESFRFMPVSRDLTQGQRTLLYAWLDSDKAHPAATLAATAPEATPEALSNVEKSRALRSGGDF